MNTAKKGHKMIDKYFPLYILSFALTFIVTVAIEKRLIPKLIGIANQPIYTDGPSWHIKKSGTPTMGGIAFVLASAISLSVSSIFFFSLASTRVAVSIIISFAYALANCLIGILDDTKKLKKRQNAGLTPMEKLILQLICAVLFLACRRIFLGDGTALSFSFGALELGLFYYPLSIFILLGIVNCANLTDGVDGLASSVAFAIGVSLFYVSAALNPETCILSAAIIGITVGFLIFNLHPAKIFMGDTGSLFLGAIISACAFNLNNPILIIFIAGVYVAEGVSVVIQVLFYKLTHKRIFKMAPLHHHLEKCGWSENKICIAAILATFILSVPAYIFYLP
ncbi:MAG: phospho-N-acetylmuramoyl-pentapeptide-transferase [Ruminococcaceae bacterium]|nr:phospho-N-acetylmuramoyl-pentapeptide-transferase [Oscillospiraceae bacterium]